MKKHVSPIKNKNNFAYNFHEMTEEQFHHDFTKMKSSLKKIGELRKAELRIMLQEAKLSRSKAFYSLIELSYNLKSVVGNTRQGINELLTKGLLLSHLSKIDPL